MKKWSFVLVLILSLGAVWPFFYSGFFPMHDDTQVVRVYEMSQALRDGQFPVRWVADLGYGYGYPIFNFYAPLPYYFGAFFNLIGFDALLATKIMFVFGIIFSGLTMYFLARRFWGEVGGIVAGIFYIYAPYHAVDIYVRGAVGEFWAMAFTPLVFWGLAKIFYREQNGVLIGGLGLAGVILSHNLTALMLLPFLVLSGLFAFFFSGKRKLFAIDSLLLTLCGLSLSAFYWLPALTEMGLTRVSEQIGGGANFRDHFVYLDQLWASPWGFGGSAPGRLDGMSFIIGKLHFLVGLLSLFWLSRRGVIILGWGFLILAVFLLTGYSNFLWASLPVMAFLQYPWRFLAMVILAISFLAGAFFLFLSKRGKLFLGVGLSLVMISLNLKYFRPQNFLNKTAADYLARENILWTTSRISDEYLPKDFLRPQKKEEVAWQKLEILQGKGVLKRQKVRSNQQFFDLEAKTEGEVVLNTAFFPGWRVLVDDQEREPIVKSGRMEVFLPTGTQRLEVKFVNTNLRNLANLISLTSAGFFMFFRLVKRPWQKT
jgi:hypothetical protein